MKKQDWIVVAFLFLLLLGWMVFFPRFFSGKPAAPQPKPESRAFEQAQPKIEFKDVEPVLSEAAVIDPAEAGNAVADSVIGEDLPEPPDAPVEIITIGNMFMQASFSSRGAGLLSVVLPGYRRDVERNSGPVEMDFHETPALTYGGLAGFSAQHCFKVAERSAESVSFERMNSRGLLLRRIYTLSTNDYQISVVDEFVNGGSNDFRIPEFRINLGRLGAIGKETTSGIAYMGVDAYPSIGGEKVIHWASKLPDFFSDEKKTLAADNLPEYIQKRERFPVYWIAVKSKFFVQILTPPREATVAYGLRATRKLLPGEGPDSTVKARKAEIETVSAEIQIADAVLPAGQSLKRAFTYYAGPKKYSILKLQGLGQEEVMEFGWWSAVCKVLLKTLNAIHRVAPNYGVAIILLTILVRIVFWPITHKSTESMKRMQALQPMMAEIRAKYKDNPKKLQEETMLLYKKHKVNPVSGCLPMLIQIPVFIALFVVLRSAIELRFARFLWIRDLSEPENLLAGLLPFGLSLNILPLLMVGTMYLQQKFSPSGGDPTQQRMMMVIMPVMMLVFFYNMASGLILYWTVSNVIMIVQQVTAKYRSRNQPAPA